MCFFEHPLRFELIGIGAIHGGVKVQFAEQAIDGLTLFDGVFAGEKSIFVSLDGNTRDWGVEAEGFAKDLFY